MVVKTVGDPTTMNNDFYTNLSDYVGNPVITKLVILDISWVVIDLYFKFEVTVLMIEQSSF